ncbi:putative acyl-CoA transferase [Bradyrhizobium sp. ORS 285]|uniref:CaiB/BaiF CoA transferase family protein n=1 Tax=Bradyrhizobium sp. ORS 285 TaxID=115808 RepID=UPI00024099E3|nr:CaiB/BaiF CoA-transferase family protein [Bradyrhizobium sp. ORS 285]CCD84616.1 putative acyl-CoA transferase [Bradyrhizobium sp. ORS 285]SMX57596.1 putative acyl-CoA transferase [Bradyrhizobium sp. ORS 285]
MAADFEGLLVVSIEQAVAAAYASCKLADAGARVIKIERPEGDFSRDYDHFVHGESAYFVWLNRGKESIALNLADDGDKAVLASMLAQADVFIQNLAPGAIDRLGFSMQGLRAKHERLITCAISGYGDEGPLRDAKAYDLLVQGESGLANITGNEYGAARVGVSVCDINAGMTATQAIFQALYARERTGCGRHISVSLFHAMADWMNVPYLQYAYGGVPIGRVGLHHPTIAPYGSYACGGGRSILIAIQNEREWVILCRDVLKRPSLATDPRFLNNGERVKNRAALDAEIGPILLSMDLDRAIKLLSDARLAFGRVSTLADFAEHPQNRYVEIDTPTGPVVLMAPGAVADGQVPAFGPIPALDAHGERLRREFAPKPQD